MRVLIIEDDRRYRESLATLIEHTPDLTLAGCYPDLDLAERSFREGPRRGADVALVHLAVTSTLDEELQRLVSYLGTTPIVLTELSDDPATAARARAAGADGYLPRSASRGKILSVLRAVT